MPIRCPWLSSPPAVQQGRLPPTFSLPSSTKGPLSPGPQNP